jgi:hypothetical protein
MYARNAPLHWKVRVRPSIDWAIRAAAVKHLKAALGFRETLIDKYFQTMHVVNLLEQAKDQEQDEQQRRSENDHMQPTEREAMTVGALNLPERKYRAALRTGPNDFGSGFWLVNFAHRRPSSFCDR